MKRRSVVLFAASAMPVLALGQRTAVPVPSYHAADFVQGAYRDWFAPRARDFAAQAEALHSQMAATCAAPPAGPGAPAGLRNQWTRTTLAWDRLAGVAVGPLLARRSQRQIDFSPIRPDSIERGIQAAPADLRALERIGTPAKGLGALEWLLWTRWAPLSGGACEYAALLAAEVLAEARALAAAMEALAARNWREDPAAAEAAMAEIVNQWVGGIESLRWQRIERPLRSAGQRRPPYPRMASGNAQTSWSARWEAVAALGRPGRGATAAAPGAGLVPLAAYLRGRGLHPLADRVGNSLDQVGRALGQAHPGKPDSVETLAAALAGSRRLAEGEVAPALEVQIGFSDSDGD